MKKFPLLVCILLFTNGNFTLRAQVIDPGSYTDQVYIPDDPKVNLAKNAYLLDYFLPQLLNPDESKKLSQAISLLSKNYPSAPLQFSDCVYFSDALQHCMDSTGNFSLFNGKRFPPSLRFSSDGKKNSVDSLFSIHLYPKVKLEKYVQPFYFKKFEVTNAEYNEFVNYVKDSVARRILAKNGFEDDYLLSEEDLIKSHQYTVENMPVDSDMTHWPLNKKEKVHWEEQTHPDYFTALAEIFLPEQERFYRRKEIDVRKLNYEYYSDSLGTPLPFSLGESAKSDKNRFKEVINVYPDTLCWVHDFNFANAMEPYTNMYFWHPCYANYPVVGITWRQAKAFLNWKTIEEQKKLNAKGIKLKVVYDLPSEIEWEIAATSETKDGKINSYGKNFESLADNSWLTDLMLDSSQMVNQKIKVMVDSTCMEILPVDHSGGVVDYIYEPSPYNYYHSDTTVEKKGKQYEIRTTYYYWSATRNNFLNPDQHSFNAKFSPDSYLFTTPADLGNVKKNPSPNPNGKTEIDNSQILTQLDGNGISYMGGNVSEWLNEDYTSWLPAFQTRLKMLKSIPTPDAQMEYQRELYFDAFNFKKGKLVRGGNWFDERNSFLLGKNPEGTNAKTFADPETDHCTLGFRYVIHVYKK